MANYTITLSIKNTNVVACTATYGFTSDLSSSSTTTVASGNTTQVQLETDDTSGTIYCKFSADGYTDSDIASITFEYNPLYDFTISGTYASSGTSEIYLYNGSPLDLTMSSLVSGANVVFGLTATSSSLTWTNGSSNFAIKSNEKLLLCTTTSATSGEYRLTIGDKNAQYGSRTIAGTLS